jgi:hypothetical protein
MTVMKRLAVCACLGLGLMGTSGTLLHAASDRHSGRYPDAYTGLRDVVDRTQADLKTAADLETGKNDHKERYKDAQGHLSTFDRKLVNGKFDKDELNKAIDKIKSILDKNVLQASTRDILMRDVTDLKVARDRRE